MASFFYRLKEKIMYKSLINVVFLALLTSCTTAVTGRGHDLSVEMVKNIIPGKTTKNEIEHNLGSPNTITLDNKWIYMSSLESRMAFFKPKILDRNILEIKFNHDIVDNYEYHDNVKTIDIVAHTDETKIRGLKRNEFKSFVKNIGKFSAPQGRRGKKPKF